MQARFLEETAEVGDSRGERSLSFRPPPFGLVLDFLGVQLQCREEGEAVLWMSTAKRSPVRREQT